MSQYPSKPIAAKVGHFRSRALLDLAKGQPCQSCGAEDGTTVAAHANWHCYGKGGGIKAEDWAAAWLCAYCHAFVDQMHDPDNRFYDESRREVWERAFYNTLHQLFAQELIKVTQ